MIRDEGGRVLATKSKYLGDGLTSNVAEWSALEGAVTALLHLCRRTGRVEAEIRSDSELLVRQFNGQWKIKSPPLAEIAGRVKGLLAQNQNLKVKVVHVPREENALADAAANRELDSRLKIKH